MTSSFNKPKTICVAVAVLRTDSECSFIMHKLRLFTCFFLVSAFLKTFLNGLLIKIEIAKEKNADTTFI